MTMETKSSPRFARRISVRPISHQRLGEVSETLNLALPEVQRAWQSLEAQGFLQVTSLDGAGEQVTIAPIALRRARKRLR